MLRIARVDGRPLRVGHRGVAALAPENTLASLRLAAELGLELVEFDVEEQANGSLVLAHELSDASEPATLEQALRLFAGELTQTALQVDLKRSGYEQAVVGALQEHGLVGRTLVSSPEPTTLRRIGALEPGLATSLSYPDDRHGLTRRPRLAPAVHVGLRVLRATLPRRLVRMCRGLGVSAVTLHHSVISAELIRRCDAAGLPVLAWTVDDPMEADRLDALGVAAIITNDPRIFRLLN